MDNNFKINSKLVTKITDLRERLQKERNDTMILRKKCMELAVQQFTEHLMIINPDSSILLLLKRHQQQALLTPTTRRLSASLTAQCSVMDLLSSAERSLCCPGVGVVEGNEGHQVDVVPRAAGPQATRRVAFNINTNPNSGVCIACGYWLRNRTVVFNNSSSRHESRERTRREEESTFYWLRNRTVVFGNSTNCVVPGGRRGTKKGTERDMTFREFEAPAHSTPQREKRR